jgi:hypothetical protein
MNKKSQIFQNIVLKTFNVEIPSYQRVINNEHVEKIYFTSLQYLKQNISPPFPPISIGRYLETCNSISVYKYYVIDGQHRYQAYMKLHNSGYNFNVDIHIIDCQDINEAIFFYSIMNSRLEHSVLQVEKPDIFIDLDKQIISLINTQIDKFVSKSNGQRPKIRIPTFIDKYMKSSLRQNINCVEDFNKLLYEQNETMRYKLLNDPSYFSRFNITKNLWNKANTINWYLGLDLELGWII